jgi:hypothetical protein
LDAALRHLAEQQRRSLTSHPTPQELAAYHAGELPPEAEAKILDHLAVCRECSDLLLDLSGFADLKPPAGVPELTDQQVEEDWQALRARMRTEEGTPRTNVVPIRPAGPVARPGHRNSPWLPLAASILAVLGFSFGIYQSVQLGKQRQLWSTTYLSLEDSTQRSGSAEEAQSMSSRVGAVLLLYPEADKLYSAYEVEIVGQTKVPATPPREVDQAVPLVIQPGFLKPGSYEIRLLGVEGDQRVELGTYQLRVHAP